MTPMFADLRWNDVVLRLVLTVVASLVIGYNRSEHGKAAGICTTMLVCTAAAIAMLQVNSLLSTAGRTSDSFVMNDLMRLPLGILTGMGFIGGGAILRRDNIVEGVTTAATLWLVTVIGLCLGGGQIALGLAAAAIGCFALWVVKWIESYLHQAALARLSITLDEAGPSEAALRTRIASSNLQIVGVSIAHRAVRGERRFTFEVRQLRRSRDTETPALVRDLFKEAGVVEVRWNA